MLEASPRGFHVATSGLPERVESPHFKASCLDPLEKKPSLVGPNSSKQTTEELAKIFTHLHVLTAQQNDLQRTLVRIEDVHHQRLQTQWPADVQRMLARIEEIQRKQLEAHEQIDLPSALVRIEEFQKKQIEAERHTDVRRKLNRIEEFQEKQARIDVPSTLVRIEEFQQKQVDEVGHADVRRRLGRIEEFQQQQLEAQGQIDVPSALVRIEEFQQKQVEAEGHTDVRRRLARIEEFQQKQLEAQGQLDVPSTLARIEEFQQKQVGSQQQNDIQCALARIEEFQQKQHEARGETDVQRALARIEEFQQKQADAQMHLGIQRALVRIEDIQQKQLEVQGHADLQSTLVRIEELLRNQLEILGRPDVQNALGRIEESLQKQPQIQWQSALTRIEELQRKQLEILGRPDVQNTLGRIEETLQKQVSDGFSCTSSTKLPLPQTTSIVGTEPEIISASPEAPKSLARLSAMSTNSTSSRMSSLKTRREALGRASTNSAMSILKGPKRMSMMGRSSQMQTIPLFCKHDLCHLEGLDKNAQLDKNTQLALIKRRSGSREEDGRRPSRKTHHARFSDEGTPPAQADGTESGKVSDLNEKLDEMHSSSSEDGKDDGGEFVVHELWSSMKQRKTPQTRGARSLTNTTMEEASRTSQGQVLNQRSTDGAQDNGVFCLLSPAGHLRLGWDLASAVMMAYEAIATPFMLAFDPPVTAATQAFRGISLSFWIFDVFISFLTGYYSDGVLVTHHKMIAIHYLRTWFALDVFVIVLDVLSIFLEGPETTGSGLGRILKILRVVRALRLLRLLKFSRILDQMYDNINSQYLHVFSTVLVKLASLLALTHFVACGWFLVGSWGNTSSWIIKFVQERPIHYQYSTSVHWAISQVHGSMEVVATTTPERIYSVFVLLVALVYFSVFLAHLASVLGELVHQKSARAHEFWLLRRYLKQMAISTLCTSRILKYLQYVTDKNERIVSEESITMLSFLSKPLHDELKLEIYAGHLSKHVLFDFMHCCMRHCLKATVDAFSTILMSAGDIVFMCGENADTMFFLTDGDCEYCYEDTRKKAKHGPRAASQRGSCFVNPGQTEALTLSVQFLRETVKEGEWVCEAALWVQGWEHLGDLVSNSMCQFLAVDSEVLRMEALTHADVAQTMLSWAVCFVKRLNKIESHDITDLLHLTISPHDVLADMGVKIRQSKPEHHHLADALMSMFRSVSTLNSSGSHHFCRVFPQPSPSL